MKSWYSVKNVANKADISIHDEIGIWGVSAKDFIEELNALEGLEQITLSIHSPGGSVFDGLAIYNSLKKHSATVNVEIIGLAASAASFIAMAGDHIEMPVTAEMMIHNAWTISIGNADDMEEAAQWLRHVDNTIVNVYQERTGLESQAIRDMMGEEKWMNGEEAKSLGFVDSNNEKQAAACARGWNKHFKQAPSLSSKAIEFEDWKDLSNWLSESASVSNREREQVMHAIKELAQRKSEPSQEPVSFKLNNFMSTLERGISHECI